MLPLVLILPLAGALPFVFAAAMAVGWLPPVAPWVSADGIAASYGLLIVSFMAGVHWGQYLSGHRLRLSLLLTSNAVALAAWFSFLLLPVHGFFIVLIVLFLVLYLLDWQLASKSAIDGAYFRVRGIVTALVCASLAVVAHA